MNNNKDKYEYLKTPSFKKVLGAKIKALRLQLELNQEQFAEKLHYTGGSSTISQIENGLKGMTFSKICETAELCDIHPMALLSPVHLSPEQLKAMIDIWKLFQAGGEAKEQLKPIYTLLSHASDRLK